MGRCKFLLNTIVLQEDILQDLHNLQVFHIFWIRLGFSISINQPIKNIVDKLGIEIDEEFVEFGCDLDLTSVLGMGLLFALD